MSPRSWGSCRRGDGRWGCRGWRSEAGMDDTMGASKIDTGQRPLVLIRSVQSPAPRKSAMAKAPIDPNKKYLSHTLAMWACGLKYEDLSKDAIQKAKLFWYDSLGCALGGSQQEDAHILLAHHKEMGAGSGST